MDNHEDASSTSNMHTSLPVPDSKYAPRTFDSTPTLLRSLIQRFEKTCLCYNVTSDNRCQGLLEYCSPKVARMLQSLPENDEEEYSVTNVVPYNGKQMGNGGT